MKFRRSGYLRQRWRSVIATVFVVLLAPLSGRADNTPVAELMQQLAGDVRSVMPLMYRPEDSLNLNEMNRVQQAIGNMQEHLGTVEKALAPRSGTYRVSLGILGEQLGQAERELEGGRVEYGMGLLRSAVSVCASCHTQDDRTAKWLAPTDEIMKDDFVAGEYFFMTRQYDRAFDAFQDWLGEQNPLPYDKRALTAFQRLLITALQVRKSADDINEALNGYIRQDHTSFMLKTHLAAWREGVEDLQALTDITAHPEPDRLRRLAGDWLNTSRNERLAHVYLPENDRPRIVWLRGELYRALNEETDRDAIPQWLYWLAVSDRLLEYRFFYSLADMYLKQCMLDYSDTPVARQCYREYENFIEFFYSGSGGTFIPEDVKQELETLETKVFND